MDISVLGASASGSRDEWDAFVASHDGGSFYHCYAWKSLNEQELRHTSLYLEARDGGSLTGVLPLIVTRSRIFGTILCSLPFVNWNGLKFLRFFITAQYQSQMDSHENSGQY